MLHNDDIRSRIARALPEVVAIRRDLHAHPELGYEEHRTSKVISDELTRIGVEHVTGLAGGTGVLAHLPSTAGDDASSIALRADIDALPIEELTGAPHASTSPGVMHACGHDGHTANLLGVARVLNQLTHRPNPVTLLFQPAEEGGAGAKKMCEDGALAGTRLGPPVTRIYGLHGWPELPVGTAACKPGPLLAATDAFDVVIHGKQTHAAYPHLGVDPIVAASHVISALQTVASRCVAPTESCIVTVGQVHAGTARNIIPHEARLSGTARTLSELTRKRVRDAFRRVVEQTAGAHGCTATITWSPGYPVTSNDPETTERFFALARKTLGDESVFVVPEPSMGGEDFAFYGQIVPACFFLIGVRPRGRDSYPFLHQPTFDFNDDALPVGMELMCGLALAEN